MGDWISTHEASQLSGYSLQYLRRLIRKSKVLADKKGNNWWVDRKSLLTYIKAAGAAEDGRYGAKADTKPQTGA